VVNFGSNIPALNATDSAILLLAGNANSVYFGGKMTGSFTATLTGLTTSPTSTVYYSINSDIVCMEFPSQVLGTSNSAFFTLTGVPADVIPATRQWVSTVAQDNGVDIFASVVIETDGTMTMYSGASLTSGSWTGSGSKGLQPHTVTYRRS